MKEHIGLADTIITTRFIISARHAARLFEETSVGVGKWVKEECWYCHYQDIWKICSRGFVRAAKAVNPKRNNTSPI